MSRFEHQWQKLAALAREAPGAEGAAPYGFAGRIVAQADAAHGLKPWAALERFAVRGFLAATACCVGAVTFSLFSWPGDTSVESLEETVNGTSVDLS